jgi:CxxC motif-containing protein (DUF1111 family)
MSADVQAGKVLFTHLWQPHDPLCPGGDGLGPVYNATSCAACHHRGGPGGAGGLDDSVLVFATVPNKKGEGLREGVIHAYAVEASFRETLALLSPRLPAISRLAQLPDSERRHHRHRLVEMFSRQARGLQLGQRKTPALFGAGLIDSIPDRVILNNVKASQEASTLGKTTGDPRPVGRAARLPDGRVGRFGWKAQSARLSDFVRAACANELGLSNPGNPQARSLARPDYRPAGLDLSSKQCDQLTTFVAWLPRPVERTAASPGRRTEAEGGKAVFHRIGCAACHVPDLGSVRGIYSDLLLHRLGGELASGGSSYGRGMPVLVQSRRAARDKSRATGSLSERARSDEWRTPPLWGVADSAPYLHDGRADTLEEAIRLHSGQADNVARRFAKLSRGEQDQLITFLECLRAPGPPAP